MLLFERAKRPYGVVMSKDGDKKSQYEIVASWAPADPRDRVFDQTASKAEKTASFYRIIAAFHPVLNIPVLFYDSFVRLGWKVGMLIWVLVAGLAACGLYFVY